MDPLWKMPSGNFAGYRSGDYLYNSSGDCAGFFVGDDAYSLDGEYIGEIVNGDWIGKRSSVAKPSYAGRVGTVGYAVGSYADRAGSPLAGYEEPDF